LVFLIIFLLIGIFWVSYAFTETITLSNYEIEHKTLFRNKRILFIGIRGRRVFLFRPRYRRSFRYLIVESKDERVQILIMERHFKFDDGFYRWFYQLPDLEETDKMADKNKLGDG